VETTGARNLSPVAQEHAFLALCSPDAAPVAGIGVGFTLTGQLFNGMLPAWLDLCTHCPLGNVAASFAVVKPLDWSRTTPVVATAVATVALCVLVV
jgi:hypothetical protein